MLDSGAQVAQTLEKPQVGILGLSLKERQVLVDRLRSAKKEINTIDDLSDLLITRVGAKSVKTIPMKCPNSLILVDGFNNEPHTGLLVEFDNLYLILPLMFLTTKFSLNII